MNDILRIYLMNLRLHENNEKYETLMLAILNKDYLNILNMNIGYSLKESNLNTEKGKKDFNIVTNIELEKEYKKAIRRVLSKKYIKENFTEYEIVRKRNLLITIFREILSVPLFYKAYGEYGTYSRLDDKYPTISHKIINSKNEIQLSFHKGTPAKDINSYIREILNIKNSPKKSKLTLGKMFRINEIYEEVKEKRKGTRTKNFYTETEAAKIYSEKYKENMSTDNAKKLITRFRKIKKEME